MSSLEKENEMQIGSLIIDIIYEFNNAAIFWEWNSLSANAF